MKGVVSFHPVDVEFFDGTIAPLLSGKKIDPDAFLARALPMRRYRYEVRRYASSVETLIETAGPAKPNATDNVLKKFKTHLESFDYRPDQATRIVLKAVDRDLHLHGRPFLITEMSAGRVAEVVNAYRTAPSAAAVVKLVKEQLGKLDPELPELVPAEDHEPLTADLNYRADLLAEFTMIFEIARAARAGGTWRRGSDEVGRPAIEVLCEEVPWRALALHACAMPFWTARDVDGLETVCRATRVPAPDTVVSARRLFAEAIEAFPVLGESLPLELDGPRSIAAFIAPADVPGVLEFLNAQGGKIIAAAAQSGEGPACAALLRKIKECATYAVKHSLGYLEASGILPEVETPVAEARS
jgi:hypothetical protein